jgi:hypothetical protein
MNKLYIFAIGGTGVRVMKAITFLLASGVKLKNDFEIVPIIVDPHAENENLKEVNKLLRLYDKIREAIGESDHFFHTKIRTLKSLSENDTITDSYFFRLGGTQNQEFKDFLSFDSLSPESQALVRTLFSDIHLNTDMDIGFVGNPNMGSVVLNQFKNSQEFKSFANNFSKGDRIFIISSIFGGTGAAGFPIILKNIRRAENDPSLSNKSLLKNAPIGGLTVQPYFGVDADGESAIQKADWMLKTKSAFEYYQKAVTSNQDPSINAMYYLSDTLTKSYDNDPGENGQKNPAHLVELIGALMLFDFANTNESLLETNNGKPVDPFAREFGVLNNKRELSFLDFGDGTRKMISRPLTKLFFTLKYLQESLEENKSQPFTKKQPELDNSFFSSAFYENQITRFFALFDSWLKDMEQNERAFKPFHRGALLPESIEGFSAEDSLFKKKLNYTRFTGYLNEVSDRGTFTGPESKFLTLFNEAGETILSNYFKSIRS